MASIDEIRQVRLEKLKKLEELGLNPYPIQTNKSHTINQVLADFDNLEKNQTEITLIGRILAKRGQGGLAFTDLFDGTAKIQALFKEDNNIEYLENNKVKNSFKLFTETVDQSDFIEVSGNLMITKRGEKSLEVKKWRMIAKSLRAVPDSWFGLKDEDERYRRRYLDILLNEEIRNRVRQRSIFWNTFRDFMLRRDFIEVETPVLETTTGGADAKPFVTHHNALDIDVYLRISCGELWQKKLMVAGIPKTFEIGRIFRNEGMSNEHLQDYTQIEFYEAFSDYTKGMKMIQELYREVAEKTFGRTKFEIDGQEIDLADEWQIFNMTEILKEKTGLDINEDAEQKIIRKVEELGLNPKKEKLNRERATDLLWKNYRGEYPGPGFLVGVPIFLEPLAKKDPTNPKVVERFQVILGGSEVGKGFSELNDPVDQTERFLHQEKLRAEGDDEAQMKDDEYVEAMEYGMPPAFGFGTSERMFAILCGVSVREAQIFPLMRPR